MTEDWGVDERSTVRSMRSEVLQQMADRLHMGSGKTSEVQGTVRQGYESRSLVDA